jgi:hypothetical protein
MEKGILKLQEMFDGDATVVSKIIALSNRYSTWRDKTSSSPSIDSSSTPSTRASGNSSKSLIAILRSDQKLWPFRTVNQAWRDHTSSTPSMDSTSTSWKKAS